MLWDRCLDVGYKFSVTIWISVHYETRAASFGQGGMVAISIALNRGVIPSCWNCVIVKTPGDGGGVFDLESVGVGTV